MNKINTIANVVFLFCVIKERQLQYTIQSLKWCYTTGDKLVDAAPIVWKTKCFCDPDAINVEVIDTLIESVGHLATQIC